MVTPTRQTPEEVVAAVFATLADVIRRMDTTDQERAQEALDAHSTACLMRGDFTDAGEFRARRRMWRWTAVMVASMRGADAQPATPDDGLDVWREFVNDRMEDAP